MVNADDGFESSRMWGITVTAEWLRDFHQLSIACDVRRTVREPWVIVDQAGKHVATGKTILDAIDNFKSQLRSR